MTQRASSNPDELLFERISALEKQVRDLERRSPTLIKFAAAGGEHADLSTFADGKVGLRLYDNTGALVYDLTALGTAVSRITPALWKAEGEIRAGAVEVVRASSNTVQVGGFAVNPIYTSADLVLTAGIWRIDASAYMSSTSNPDSKQLSLWNATDAVEVPNARGAPQDITAIAVSLGFQTSCVVTLTATKTIRLVGVRNGGSGITFGAANSMLRQMQLMATRIG